jgi:multidrug resistance protein, MATE family
MPLATAPTYRRILVLAAPLVLSSTGMMIMQVIDAIFLARYSKEAMAASVTAGLAGFSACALFIGLAGYTSVFVAQYIGAGRPERVGAAVWQGIWFSFAAGLAVALIGLTGAWLFRHAGHDAAVWQLEAAYFRILCFGGVFSVLACALSGFFSGRGDNLTLGLVQLAGLAVNALMSWMLIFGRWGCPELGAAGAAVGTVIGQSVVCLGLGGILLLPRYSRSLGTWNARLEWVLLRRLMRYGVPAGVRLLIELTAWTLFTSFIGRLGAEPQAATGIVFRVNALAFFPLFGIGMAISTLVGQGQGMNRPDLGQQATWRGLLISQIWMFSCAALFVLMPRPLLAVFHEQGGPDAAAWARTLEMGVVLLRFVAVYCLVDAVNVVVVSALQGAGDTTWTLAISILLYTVFLSALWLLQRAGAGIYALWSTATLFLLVLSLVMLARFHSGRWKAMTVVESTVV